MYDGPVQDLIDELGRLPGIGPKSAQRIAFWLPDQPAEDINRLAEVLVEVKRKVRFCQTCFNVTDVAINEQLGNCTGNEAERLAALQGALRCGTNCGSCIPELKRMVRIHPVVTVAA